MATPRSSQTFCARPGCGLAKSGHGFMPDACSNFIQPGSKEAHEAKRAKLTLVEPSLNAMARDAAVAELREALRSSRSSDDYVTEEYIISAIARLEAIS